MAQDKESPDSAESAGDLRGTLIKRLAVAGGLVAVLLGVLAFFDHLANTEEPEAPAYAQTATVSPKKEVTQPVTPVEPLPEPSAPEDKVTDPPAEPPVVEAPPGPDVTAAPAAAAADSRVEPRAAAKPASQRLAPPVQAAKAALVEATAADVPNEPKVRFALQPPRPAAAAPLVQAPAPLRLLPGYVLQAGVFTNIQRAEELHAKLALNGIPSTLETRVQAGPFKTKDEAAAAREKLRALGIDVVLIPPKGGR